MQKLNPILDLSNLNYHEFIDKVKNEIIPLDLEKYSKKETFKICFSGGNSVKKLLESFAFDIFHYSNWEIWMLDERCYPKDHPELNQTLIRELLITPFQIPEIQFHPMEYYSEDDSNLQEYRNGVNQCKNMDLIIMGIGNDGHVASLFPKTDFLSEKENVILIQNSPKPPPRRMTLSMNYINQANRIIALALGDDKKELINLVKRDETLPVNHLNARVKTNLYFYTKD